MSPSSGVGGLMRGIKIPQQDFTLKRQGGLCARGGRICGTLWYFRLQFVHSDVWDQYSVSKHRTNAITNPLIIQIFQI